MLLRAVLKSHGGRWDHPISQQHRWVNRRFRWLKHHCCLHIVAQSIEYIVQCNTNQLNKTVQINTKYQFCCSQIMSNHSKSIPPFMDDFPIETSIYVGFPSAMFDHPSKRLFRQHMLSHAFDIQSTLHILDVTAKTAEAPESRGTCSTPSGWF